MAFAAVLATIFGITTTFAAWAGKLVIDFINAYLDFVLGVVRHQRFAGKGRACGYKDTTDADQH